MIAATTAVTTRRFRSDHARLWRYRASSRSSARWDGSRSQRFSHPRDRASSVCGVKSVAASRAVSVNDTTAEESRARMMAHTIPSNMNCTMPPENASGSSAMHSMNVIARTARRTALMPSIAASLGDLPMRRCRSIEWMSMIESSTSRPIESRSPISVELLSVMPSGTMASRVMPSVIGMVISEMSVPRMLPRKKSTTTPVRSTAMTSSSTMFLMR